MKRIGVVAGGYSAEKIISIKSAETVLNALKTSDYESYLIIIDRDSWYVEKNEKKYIINRTEFSVDIDGDIIYFDVVFMTIHGPPGENGELQLYLDKLGIPYTTSGYKASKLSFNKFECNNFLRKHNVLCAKSILIKLKQDINPISIINHVGLPCFVKPNKNGSSFGISKIEKKENLITSIEKAFNYDNEVIIESFLEGREITCGIHNFNNELETFPCTEIITQNQFFDFEAKYKGQSNEITPANLPIEIQIKISNRTKEIYKLLKLNGIARIDFILYNEEPYIIEANTVPGLSKKSIIPQQAKAKGVTLKELFDAAIQHAMN